MNTKIFKEINDFVNWTIEHENAFLTSFFVMIYVWFIIAFAIIALFLMINYPLIFAVGLAAIIWFVFVPMYKADKKKKDKQ